MSNGRDSSSHPPIPPTTEEEGLLWLRLLRSRRVGATTFHRMLSEYTSVGAAFDALPRIAADAGVEDYQPCDGDTAKREMDAAQRFGAVPLYYGALCYPKALYDLPDAPPLLWAYGNISLLEKPKVALVGARNASSLGLRMARGLSKDLGAEGHVVVSGLARGIDAAAHDAAIMTGTIAVFAGGVDVIYPAENTDLAKRIGETGLLLSEQPMGLQPRSMHFPARNRIISGLSRAVVVVEAATKSGSLITARNALDQGREVFAVPGHPIESRASGCNLLIRDGATLVRSGADILEAIAPIAPTVTQPQLAFELSATPETGAAPPERSLRETSQLHRQIMDRVGQSSLPEDTLIRELNSPTEQTMTALMDLELDGRISRSQGGMVTGL